MEVMENFYMMLIMPCLYGISYHLWDKRMSPYLIIYTLLLYELGVF